jgi:hypothetical protein
MSMHQSDKRGPAIDDALQDERRQTSAGARHRGRPNEGLDEEEAVHRVPPEPPGEAEDDDRRQR